MNAALHLVIAPATAEITPREPAPATPIVTCKVIKIAGSLIIFADSNTSVITETELLQAVFAQLLCPLR